MIIEWFTVARNGFQKRSAWYDKNSFKNQKPLLITSMPNQKKHTDANNKMKTRIFFKPGKFLNRVKMK